MIPLLVGTALAVAALAFVLYPFFRTSPRRVTVQPQPVSGERSHGEGRQSAIEALREIEFDRATGKLSDSDYESLRARYTSAAVIELRDAEAGVSSGGAASLESLDAAEALISRFRSKGGSCSTCGPRPEPDATYCSNCGRFLPGNCGRCGAAVSEPGAQFCSSCGARLAA